MNYFTYILFSEKLNRYYIGSSQNITKRLERHNAGATKSIKAGRTWKIVYFEEYNTKAEAMKRENYIKRMKSKTFVKSRFAMHHLFNRYLLSHP
ncbi:MAG: GIY-YIG nuclease family protein [Bacteroidota bacterium]